MKRIMLAAAAALLVAVCAVDETHASGWGWNNRGSCNTCATNSCNDGCQAPSFWSKFKWGGSGCDTGCHGGCGSACGDSSWMWWRKPCPSDAPTRRIDAPLAFPNHPYARSPRDYFMQD